MRIDVSQLKRLGIDEIALHKGQDNFIVVLVDLDQHQLIGFAESRKQEDVSRVLEGWGTEVLEQIIEVSIDLSGNYKSLIKKMMPNADITADRFHVMQMISKELNIVRIREIKANESNKSDEEKERIKSAFKSSKYALLKPEENLTEKQKLKLEEVKAISPILAQMHQQKEAIRNIFETATDWTEGTFKIMDWMADAQDSFNKSVGTMYRWLSEITGYFENRTTSGVVEGINNRLKLIKRLGYGFRNFENFKLRCLICWHLDVNSA